MQMDPAGIALGRPRVARDAREAGLKGCQAGPGRQPLGLPKRYGATPAVRSK
jgi:hypothetical protein